MFLNDTFRSGQLVMPIPVGVPLTLQYNPRGILEKVYSGFDDDTKVEVSYNLFDCLYNSSLIPVKIPIIGGTTWVKGVLYSGRRYKISGKLPDCIINDMCCDFCDEISKYDEISDAHGYNFFAGYVKSLAVALNNGAAIKRWLKLAKFNILPSFLVPAPLSEESFNYALNSDFPFIKNIIGYIIYDIDNTFFVDTNLYQYKINRSKKYTDEYGYIKSKLSLDDDNCMYVDYTDVVRYNLSKNCFVVIHEGHIIDVFNIKSDISNTISCEWCGRSLSIPEYGYVKCSDIHCLSSSYELFNHFLQSYDMPFLSFEDYKKFVFHKDIHELVDIFDVHPWNTYTIDTSLYQLLRSVIPITYISSSDVIRKFTACCNGNPNMFKYYIDNPSAIQSDFHLTGNDVSKLIQWLSDRYNFECLFKLLESDHINLVDIGKRFNGSPIFKNKNILITGEFKHGTHDDIRAILKSYGAHVCDTYDSDVDCLIIGSTFSDINSKYVMNARSANIPIFNESEFFSIYKIDSDMQNDMNN